MFKKITFVALGTTMAFHPCIGAELVQSVGRVVFGLHPTSAEVISKAMRHGYRQFDTAKGYNFQVKANELLMSSAKQASIPRDSLFIIDKVPSGLGDFETTKLDFNTYVSQSVATFGYIDCLMFHDPYLIQPYFLEQFVALQKEGKIKNYGFSNVTTDQYRTAVSYLTRTYPTSTINPSVEIECNPVFCDLALIKAVQEQGGEVYGYRPFGSNDPEKKIRTLKSETILSLSTQYDLPPAGIIQSWLNTHGITPIISTTSDNHMQENLLYKTKTLSQEDTLKIDAKLTAEQLTGWQKFSKNRDGSPSYMMTAAETFWSQEKGNF